MKQVAILIGRGEQCLCPDCEVLYGGSCPWDKKKFREEMFKKYPHLRLEHQKRYPHIYQEK